MFFGWLLEEGEIARSPLARMQPRIPEEPPPVPSEDDLRRLFKMCQGKGFDESCDLAILRLLADTGMRSAELVGLKASDIDFTDNVAVVLGKGQRAWVCPSGRRTALALDRCLRARHRYRLIDRS